MTAPVIDVCSRTNWPCSYVVFMSGKMMGRNELIVYLCRKNVYKILVHIYIYYISTCLRVLLSKHTTFSSIMRSRTVSSSSSSRYQRRTGVHRQFQSMAVVDKKGAGAATTPPKKRRIQRTATIRISIIITRREQCRHFFNPLV